MISTRSRRLVLMVALLESALASPCLADLRFDAPNADAGEVRSGRPLTHRFAFVNVGKEPIEIVGLRASCGCARTRLDRHTIAPGEKGELHLDVRTLSQPAGEHTWRIDLAYRQGRQTGEATLTLRARVAVDVQVQPAALTLTTDRIVRHQVVLTDHRTQPLTVTEVRSSSPHLQARAAPASTNAAGHRLVTVEVSVAPIAPQGRHEATLTLHTDDPYYRELTVPVTVVKRPRQDVTASPAEISLWAPRGQPAPSRIVLLRPAGEEIVEIERVETDDVAVTATWAAGPNNLATLRVKVDRSQVQGGELRSAVHVFLRKPARETVTIPLTFAIEP